MKIGLAQLNTTVGDLAGNHRKILNAVSRTRRTRCRAGRSARNWQSPGYPPLDLVFKSRFVPLNLAAVETLRAEIGDVPLLVGYVDVNAGTGQPFHNAAALLQRGRPMRAFFKSLLPTYDVFDEDRYFEPARAVAPVEIGGREVGITICEDIWTEKYLPRRLYGTAPVDSLIDQGAQIIINLSASPFALGKSQRRFEMLSGLAGTHRVPIFYCNAVGGNDQLIFDGNSLAIAADGSMLASSHHLPKSSRSSIRKNRRCKTSSHSSRKPRNCTARFVLGFAITCTNAALSLRCSA
jgi:predicted amidohydrolase